MPFDPHIAALRFGFGLSPLMPPPASAAAMLALLAGPDDAAARHPIPAWPEARPSLADLRDLNRRRRAAPAGPERDAVEAEHAAAVQAARAARLAAFGATLARAATAQDALRERLVAFWASHFAIRARTAAAAHLVTPFVEEAIRPHVAGRFADMLRAVTTHPMMLDYLDQSRSVGPNSDAARRRDTGLNENLARELLELHTLGVDGPYDQRDVRELAELLTGLAADPDRGTVWRPDAAEPGAETVLGVTFSAEADLATVHAALDMLAAHPATARHLGRKIARHFVADDPDPALVEALAATFAATGGDLLAVTATLLDHPAAWAGGPGKVKPPFAFLASALRAFAVPEATIRQTDPQEAQRLFLGPLALMGQPWETPPGPNGWPEEAAAWVAPQFVAARIDWAMTRPRRLIAELPDPRAFVAAALGPLAPEAVIFAAGAAEDRATGIGIVLASPAFQRR